MYFFQGFDKFGGIIFIVFQEEIQVGHIETFPVFGTGILEEQPVHAQIVEDGDLFLWTEKFQISVQEEYFFPAHSDAGQLRIAGADCQSQMLAFVAGGDQLERGCDDLKYLVSFGIIFYGAKT